MSKSPSLQLCQKSHHGVPARPCPNSLLQNSPKPAPAELKARPSGQPRGQHSHRVDAPRGIAGPARSPALRVQTKRKSGQGGDQPGGRQEAGLRGCGEGGDGEALGCGGRARGGAHARCHRGRWRRRRHHSPRAAACFLAFSLRSAMLEFLLVVLAAAAAATTEAAEAESAASVASGSPKGGAGNIM